MASFQIRTFTRYEKDSALQLRAKEEGMQAESQYGDWLRGGPDRARKRVFPGGRVESSSGLSTSAKEKEKLSSPAAPSKSRMRKLE